MILVALGIGSNIDAASNIRKAIAALQSLFGEVRCSSVYESEAVGFDGDNFLNLVALIETDKPIYDLDLCLKKIEDAQGRDRKAPRFFNRTLDIDILTYGDCVGDYAGIHLPRAEITANAFVLQPLAELLPDTVHLVEKKSYQELWNEYRKDAQKLWKVKQE